MKGTGNDTDRSHNTGAFGLRSQSRRPFSPARRGDACPASTLARLAGSATAPANPPSESTDRPSSAGRLERPSACGAGTPLLASRTGVRVGFARFARHRSGAVTLATHRRWCASRAALPRLPIRPRRAPTGRRRPGAWSDRQRAVPAIPCSPRGQVSASASRGLPGTDPARSRLPRIGAGAPREQRHRDCRSACGEH